MMRATRTDGTVPDDATSVLDRGGRLCARTEPSGRVLPRRPARPAAARRDRAWRVLLRVSARRTWRRERMAARRRRDSRADRGKDRDRVARAGGRLERLVLRDR